MWCSGTCIHTCCKLFWLITSLISLKLGGAMERIMHGHETAVTRITNVLSCSNRCNKTN